MADLQTTSAGRFAARLSALAQCVLADILIGIYDLYVWAVHGGEAPRRPVNRWLMGIYYVSRCKHRVAFRGYDCYYGMTLADARWIRYRPPVSPSRSSQITEQQDSSADIDGGQLADNLQDDGWAHRPDEPDDAPPTLDQLEAEWNALLPEERDAIHEDILNRCMLGTADVMRFYPLLMTRALDDQASDCRGPLRRHHPRLSRQAP